MSAYWRDDRVWCRNDEVKDPEAWNAYTWKEGVDEEEVWTPELEIINRAGDDNLEEEMREVVQIKGRGVFVIQHMAFKGDLGVQMDLAQFPFDDQNLTTVIRSRDFGRDVVEVVSSPQQNMDMGHYIDSRVNSPDFHIKKLCSTNGEHIYQHLTEVQGTESSRYSNLSIDLHVRRKSGYYLNKVWLQFNIIAVMDLFCLLLVYNDINDRNTIALTLFLTAVALSFATAGDLPRISYRTRLDNFVFLQYVLTLFIYVQNFVLYRLTVNYNVGDDQYNDIGNNATIVASVILLTFFGAINAWFLSGHRRFTRFVQDPGAEMVRLGRSTTSVLTRATDAKPA